MSIFESRASKKKKQNKKNKFQQMIYELVRLRREEVIRVEENEKLLHKTTKPDEAKSNEDMVWSAKTQEIRDRLTGKKRMSQDRWNRFAGTEGGGGRGL